MVANLKRVMIIFSFLWLAGCSEGQGPAMPTAVPLTTVAATARPSPTPTTTPTNTPLPTSTPTPTQTATPTSTPTATAVPLIVAGAVSTVPFSAPAPQAGAPCGLVDTLDFPIDPPDAATVSRGGEEFGVFRSRYDKYHAGEDWGGPAGRPNLGTPVYSIGHGLVTYAEPEGWNRDKGVVIVQHSFADGHSFYSFYGHLDPPSVVLQAGDCIQRGQQVGNIGKPRTSPHLHFEIRTHMPYAPGPGYWPEDPTVAGWLPPSQTIWQERLLAAPGVQWVRPSPNQGTQRLGLAGETTLVLLEGGQLLGLAVADGRVRWRYAFADQPTIEGGLMTASAIYLADQFGRVLALPPPAEGEPTFTPLWQLDLDVTGTPTLMPLPGGGVALATRQQLVGISAAGAVLWQHQLRTRPFAWAATGEQLLMTAAGAAGGIWTIDQSGPTAWAAPGGHAAVSGRQAWVYAAEGIYRLDEGAGAAELRLALPLGFLPSGDVVALPDGGVLLAHSDLYDRRLIALNGDGTVRWDRSFSGSVAGDVDLMSAHGRIYLIAVDGPKPASAVTVFTVDVHTAVLTPLFSGGTRSALPGDTWATAAGELLLINIGGGHLVALNPLLALEARPLNP